MAPIVHLVRHAQGYHNLCLENERLPDPDLTPLGHQQCADLRAAFPHHDRVAHLIASPMRRTLYTCIEAFGDGPRAPYPITALDTLQELSDMPSDTGSAKEKTAAEFGAKADLSRVREGWNDKFGADSPFEPTEDKIMARAREARRAIREIASRGGEDDHVVVVTHGAFLHFLTEEFQGTSEEHHTSWSNCEYRSYQFIDATGQDDGASLRETDGSWRRRRGSTARLSDHELKELRSVMQAKIVPTLKVFA